MTSVTASSSPFFQVESPYLIRNLKEALKQRQAEMLTYFRNADAPNEMFKIQGRLIGLDDALHIIEEMEQKERK